MVGTNITVTVTPQLTCLVQSGWPAARASLHQTRPLRETERERAVCHSWLERYWMEEAQREPKQELLPSRVEELL